MREIKFRGKQIDNGKWVYGSLIGSDVIVGDIIEFTDTHSKETTTEGEDQVKIYIAGKITGNPSYKQQFAEAEKKLRSQGHTTMNPAVLPDGFEHQEYMRVCFSMIDVCDAVFFLDNWRDSIGAKMKRDYAESTGKVLMFQEVTP